MRSETGKTAVVGFLFAMLLSLGAAGCLITAFDLTLESQLRIALWCGGASLFFAAAFSVKHGGILALLAVAGATLWQWRLGDLGEQFWQLVYRITHVYNEAYHWGVIQMVKTPWNAGQADLPMMALGTCLSAAAAWSVCRGKSAAIPVCLGMLPLLLCVVVTDTVPEAPYLYLLILGILLLLLTGTSRQSSPHQGNWLTIFGAVPVILGLGALFLVLPKDGYVGHAEAAREQLASWLQRLPPWTEAEPEITFTQSKPIVPENINLSTLGRRQDSAKKVLSVTAETGGTLYLRGQDYDIYDGTFWRTSENRVEEFGYEGVNLGYVVVETEEALSRMYLPYYPRGGLSLIGGKYDNLRIAASYSFVRTGLPEGWQALASAGGGDTLGGYYRVLPEETETAARELLAPILEGTKTRQDAVYAIGEYVRQSAVYDKNTDPMPEGGGDFALWFLREAETGYCVHYATAAAVLLRAAGIDARYVSGYQVPVKAGETAIATEDNAHAWVEYYEPGLDAWLILDPTPADGRPDPRQETQGQTETLAPTVPEETQPETAEMEQTIQTLPQPTFVPAETEPEPEKRPLPSWVRKTVITVCAFLLLGALLEGQYVLRRGLRRWDQSRGDRNRRALSLWREAERLGRLLGQAPPEALEALALKAKYSQHTLTEAELESFRSWLGEAERALGEKPLYLRLWYRYIFAAIGKEDLWKKNS